MEAIQRHVLSVPLKLERLPNFWKRSRFFGTRSRLRAIDFTESGMSAKFSVPIQISWQAFRVTCYQLLLNWNASQVFGSDPDFLERVPGRVLSVPLKLERLPDFLYRSRFFGRRSASLESDPDFLERLQRHLKSISLASTALRVARNRSRGSWNASRMTSIDSGVLRRGFAENRSLRLSSISLLGAPASSRPLRRQDGGAPSRAPRVEGQSSS